jgi:hypothetical protein
LFLQKKSVALSRFFPSFKGSSLLSRFLGNCNKLSVKNGVALSPRSLPGVALPGVELPLGVDMDGVFDLGVSFGVSFGVLYPECLCEGDGE